MPKKPSPDRLPVYRRVADQLRSEIMLGVLAPGDRLGSESRLSERFGVSRSSVREALRVLASERLIRTDRGATGGSTVQRLQPDDVMAVLKANIEALALAQGCSTGEMNEVRELLEVSAAWLAAARRSPMDVDRLRSCIPADPATVSFEVQRSMNLQFHYTLLEATGNRLLHIFGAPVSEVIYAQVRSGDDDLVYFAGVTADHRAIVDAIEDRDQVAARRAMARHILNARSRGEARQSRLDLHGLVFDSD